MIEQACGKLGEIEILVNSAGIGVFGPFHAQSFIGEIALSPLRRCSNDVSICRRLKFVKLHRGSEE
jgi:hypothetical protein